MVVWSSESLGTTQSVVLAESGGALVAESFVASDAGHIFALWGDNNQSTLAMLDETGRILVTTRAERFQLGYPEQVLPLGNAGILVVAAGKGRVQWDGRGGNR